MDDVLERAEAFTDFAGRVFATAETASEPHRIPWRLGPLRLDLGGNDPEVLDAFCRGLAGSPETPELLEPSARLLRIDLLVGAADHGFPTSGWPLPVWNNDHLRRRHVTGDLAISSWQDGTVWRVFDRRRGHAVYWARDVEAIPEWDLGAPFRSLLAWALQGVGLSMVHAAGVCRPGEPGLLLAGAGGAGKSSTTFVALRDAGMQGVGDDFVALATEETPEALALFTSLKLTEDSLLRLGVPPAAVVNPGRPASEKARLYQRELLPGTDLPRMAVAALVLPRLAGGASSDFRRCGGGALLRALAPSSLFLLPGRDSQRFSDLATLVRRLPCFELLLGSDVPALAATLRRLADEVSCGRA